ncbi:M20/M25/M40 family metallo-hydrolase [Streptomyces sp. NPDC051561]|uniref:M20/M25/M40 family metallo-hydrolase n=1 Tax=Streptomyces sp. NPDC051561 TaxID=3365658 RepID=UPI00378EB88C
MTALPTVHPARSFLLLLLLLAPSACTTDRSQPVPAAAPVPSLSSTDRAAVSDDAARTLSALQQIADAHHGTRASGTPGFDASAAYVADRLRAARLAVHHQSFTTRKGRRTENLWVDVPGRSHRVVVVGAHLDSAEISPGINDNGTGVAAVLAVARYTAQQSPSPHQTVRFAFWGAEETGSEGSRHYTRSLPERERARLAGYLNIDMTGTPGGVHHLVDGDRSTLPSVTGDRRHQYEKIQPAPGSGRIEQILHQALSAEGARVTSDLLGIVNTDLAGFLAWAPQVPVGGFSMYAARPRRLPSGRTEWIPCYHRPCDTHSRIDLAALRRGTLAVLTTVQTLSADTAETTGLTPRTGP